MTKPKWDLSAKLNNLPFFFSFFFFSILFSLFSQCSNFWICWSIWKIVRFWVGRGGNLDEGTIMWSSPPVRLWCLLRTARTGRSTRTVEEELCSLPSLFVCSSVLFLKLSASLFSRFPSSYQKCISLLITWHFQAYIYVNEDFIEHNSWSVDRHKSFELNWVLKKIVF